MKKTLKFSIETQTENGEVISICHLNEKVAALQTSPVAKKMFKLNRELFNKINNSTKILSCTVHRQQITATKKNQNRLGATLFNNHDFIEKEIIAASLKNNVMTKTQSATFNNKRKLYFEPSNLKPNSSTIGVDMNNLTLEDVNSSSLICELEEINLFQKNGIKTYMLTDYLSDARGLSNLSYRITFDIKTNFSEYLKYVTERMAESIDFLTNYVSKVESQRLYDASILDYKKSYRDSILKDLGISTSENSTSLNSNRIKNSEFGQAALNYYNTSILLGKTSKLIYGEIIKSLLPLPKSSLTLFKSVILKFEDLLTKVKNTYNLDSRKLGAKEEYSKINSNRFTPSEFVTSTTERLKLEAEPLGYNIFSEKQSGLNKFTVSSYKKRIGAEQTRYYPQMNLKDEGRFMNSRERSAFGSMKNAASYVTPVNLVLKNKKVSCSRGMNNIPINDVLEFRIAKSARASRNSTVGFGNTGLSKELMSTFNIDINLPATSLLERSVDEQIDPKINAKEYVGDSSFFISNDPELIHKNFAKIIQRKDEKIVSIIADIIPNTFLRQKNSIRSINDLQLSNKKSRIRNLVSNQKINIEEIPPHIKAMMTQNFQNNPNIDPLKNSESRAIIDETQKNIFVVKALTGFELDEDGIPNLNMPTLQNMDQALSSNQHFLAKGHNYEVPELGILKDNFMPTIYNNLLYIGA